MATSMQIGVRVFAILKERLGREELRVELPEGASVGALLVKLEESFPALGPYLERCMVSVNQNYEAKGAVIREGDEVALLPPVSGG